MLVMFLQGKKLRLGRFFLETEAVWLVLFFFFVSLIQIRVIWEEGIPIEKNTSIKLYVCVCVCPWGIFLINDWWRSPW